jgi:hypothetical protein
MSAYTMTRGEFVEQRFGTMIGAEMLQQHFTVADFLPAIIISAIVFGAFFAGKLIGYIIGYMQLWLLDSRVIDTRKTVYDGNVTIIDGVPCLTASVGDTDVNVRLPGYITLDYLANRSHIIHGQGKESLNPSWPRIRVSKPGNGVVSVLFEGQHVGSAGVITHGGNFYLISAAHVFDGLDGKFELHLGKIAVTFDPHKLQEQMYSSSGDMDFVVWRLSQAYVTKLGVRPLRMSDRVKSQAISVYGTDALGQWCVSSSVARLSRSRLFQIEHGASTEPSYSGSPLIQDGKMVGVHQGTTETPGKNFGINLVTLWKQFITRVESSDEYPIDQADWKRVDDIDADDDDIKAHRLAMRLLGDDYEVKFQSGKYAIMEYRQRDDDWADDDDECEECGHYVPGHYASCSLRMANWNETALVTRTLERVEVPEVSGACLKVHGLATKKVAWTTEPKKPITSLVDALNLDTVAQRRKPKADLMAPLVVTEEQRIQNMRDEAAYRKLVIRAQKAYRASPYRLTKLRVAREKRLAEELERQRLQRASSRAMRALRIVLRQLPSNQAHKAQVLAETRMTEKMRALREKLASLESQASTSIGSTVNRQGSSERLVESVPVQGPTNSNSSPLKPGNTSPSSKVSSGPIEQAKVQQGPSSFTLVSRKTRARNPLLPTRNEQSTIASTGSPADEGRILVLPPQQHAEMHERINFLLIGRNRPLRPFTPEQMKEKAALKDLFLVDRRSFDALVRRKVATRQRRSSPTGSPVVVGTLSKPVGQVGTEISGGQQAGLRRRPSFTWASGVNAMPVHPARAHLFAHLVGTSGEGRMKSD